VRVPARDVERAGAGYRRRVLVMVTVLALTAVPAGVGAGTCWSPPVVGIVVDPFRPPTCPWCPGNRGLEYRVAPGTRVGAVETGRVTFSGAVAGVRYVVVAGADGRLVTYGRLQSIAVRSGKPVSAGATIGTASGEFYFGVRVDGVYVDPAPLLGEPTGRRRLVPVDGGRPRPAPHPTVHCR
jgi:murein DD-endopeptidase MepM/ murein hydrolase activator NlpD